MEENIIKILEKISKNISAYNVSVTKFSYIECPNDTSYDIVFNLGDKNCFICIRTDGDSSIHINDLTTTKFQLKDKYKVFYLVEKLYEQVQNHMLDIIENFTNE